MARRKTVDVEFVRQWTNERLASDAYSDMEKYAFCNILDTILTQTGNYRGYGYLDQYDADNWNMKKDMRRVYYR